MNANDDTRDQLAGWSGLQTQTDPAHSGANGTSGAPPKAVISSARLFRGPSREFGGGAQSPASTSASNGSAHVARAAERTTPTPTLDAPPPARDSTQPPDDSEDTHTNGADNMLALPTEARPVNVSYRFPRGLLPSRDPRTYILSPSDLLTRRAEDFRQLRTQIKEQLGDRGTVLVASPRHSEGRSITALNLGLAFAQEYERVVYVEADFRRPALHTFFELEQGRGLSRLLRRSDPIGDDLGTELLPTDVPGFYLLPAGVRSGPPELFESPRMADIVEHLKSEADWAIIDVPPMLTYAEPQTLVKLVDGVVVLALEGRTREDDLRRLAARLEAIGGNIIGAVYVRRS